MNAQEKHNPPVWMAKASFASFAIFLLFALAAAPVAADETQARRLSVVDAVDLALSSDSRIESSYWDAQSASDKATEARLRMIPSMSLSAGYTRLSELNSTLSLGPYNFTLGSLENAFSLAATMQYPVFAGFRLRESAELARIQLQGKDIALEMTKRAVAFETQRAYWEAVRASNNVRMLRENLALSQRTRVITGEQYAQGAAMNADLLTADMRRDQATMDLAAAETAMQRAYLSLSALVSADGAIPGDPAASFVLSSTPDIAPAQAGPGEPLAGDIDADAIIRGALARRPETRSSALAVRAAETGRRIAEAPLYPTLAVSGNYTYADPNSRVAFQTDPWKFTGTWTLGASLSYDLGGLPANVAARGAQADGVKKSEADARRQNELVVIDVRNCLAAYGQIRGDIPLVTRMLEQAKENERVTAQRYQAGTASESDLLTAQLARLRSEFAIANRQIDLQIAAADLSRAAALSDVK